LYGLAKSDVHVSLLLLIAAARASNWPVKWHAASASE
jgi:hypothetical protein